mgnify:CR=1 FL=1
MKKIQVSTVKQTAEVEVIFLNTSFVVQLMDAIQELNDHDSEVNRLSEMVHNRDFDKLINISENGYLETLKWANRGGSKLERFLYGLRNAMLREENQKSEGE